MELSLRDQVDGLLTEYADTVRRFFALLASAAENVTTDAGEMPEQLVKRMVELDDQLQTAAQQIEEHQARQQRIIRVQDDIQRHHEALLRVVQKLDSARSDLDQSLNEAKKEVQAIDYANKSNVQFTDVISYASKLSKYTSAPPNFASMNRDIKVDFEKPYPDEERMRRGLLYWQNHPQPYLEDKMESSDNESSAEEDATKEGHGTAGKPAEEAAGDPFWILDLNPDLAS